MEDWEWRVEGCAAASSRRTGKARFTFEWRIDSVSPLTISIMKSFSVGIVGAGAITRNIHLPVLLAMPNVRVAWLADASANRADALGKVHGVKSLAATSPEGLPDCDVVLLAIPVGVRAAYFNALAARGAAVFTEKPFASNLAEHRRILDLFEPHRIGCGFMRRFYRGTRTVRDAL